MTKYILFLIFPIALFAQESNPTYFYTDQQMKDMGIAPRKEKDNGCSYIPVKSVFDSIKCFVSYESDVYFNHKLSKQPNIHFKFHNNKITTSLPFGDPKKEITVLGIIDTVEGHRRFQCIDNAGQFMALTFGKEDEIVISIIYKSTIFLYFVTEIPFYGDIQQVEKEGIFGDDSIGKDRIEPLLEIFK